VRNIRSALLSALLSACAVCYGQSNFTPITTGTPVTGQCNGHATEPACVLPNLFGTGGLTLSNDPAFPHYAHFIGSAQDILNQTLGSAIATQLAIQPIISPSSGFTFEYDRAAGAFVPTTTSFGPIYTERAETIGRGKISLGISYQRFRFSSIDGIDIHDIPAVFTHIPNSGPEGQEEPYESDVITASNSVSLGMDQTVLYGTVGLTDRIDLSVAVPVVSVRITATSEATIQRISGQFFSPVGTTIQLPNPHQFPNGSLTNSFSQSGSAAGIGDVTFRLKVNLLHDSPIRLAVLTDVRAPTGDPMKLLGSGAIGIKPFIAVSAGKRFSPHLNVGYEYNGSSILAGNVTGSTFTEANEMEEISNGPSIKARLPGMFFYSLGADYGATKRLTLDFDYLGQTLFNAPRAFLSTFTTEYIPGGTGSTTPQTFPTITPGHDDVGLNNGAVGFKYELFNHLLLTGDVMFRLDNHGLRQNVTPLVALSYAFGQ
jgi:Putative MetA-pathway of phenol degradation